jgi:hypothetical protein
MDGQNQLQLRFLDIINLKDWYYLSVSGFLNLGSAAPFSGFRKKIHFCQFFRPIWTDIKKDIKVHLDGLKAASISTNQSMQKLLKKIEFVTRF